MIIAIGTDAIDVSRVARAVDHPRWGERFRQRVYTAGEIAYCTRRRRNAESFAARFAAKEAVMKALGTGWAKGVWWRDIEVVRSSGPPRIVLHGGAAARAGTLGIRRWHLTLTHTAGQALATVIAEA